MMSYISNTVFIISLIYVDVRHFSRKSSLVSHRNKVSENFRNFIFQERLMLIYGAFWFELEERLK